MSGDAVASSSKSSETGGGGSGDKALPQIAITNYGSQVAYNYGMISTYFCHNPDAAHQCKFAADSFSKESVSEQLYTKLREARALYNLKRWVEAKVLFYEVLHAKCSGLPRTERVTIKYSIAYAHFALSEFSDAAQLFEDVVETQDEQGDSQDNSAADSRYLLARSYYHLEKYAAAEMHLQKFILKQDDQDKQQSTEGRLWLGLTFERLGLYDGAKEQLQIAYTTYVETFGPENLETLKNRHHLANFLYKRKAFAEAYSHFHPLLNAEERLSGPEKADAIRTRCMLAFCLVKLDRLEDAEPHLQRVLAREEACPGDISREPRDLGLVYYWLARIAMTRKQPIHLKYLEYMFQRALGGLSGVEDLREELADCRRQLALIMCHQGRFAGAEQIFRQSIDVADVSQQNELIASRRGLASVLLSQRKITEAKATLEEVVSVNKPILSNQGSREDLSGCLQLLGEAHFQLEEFCEARDCFQRLVNDVYDTSERSNNPPRVWLAKTFFRLQEFESARQHFQRAYDVVKQHLGRREPHDIKAWLAWTLCELGLFDEAESLVRTVFATFPQSEKGPSPLADLYLGFSSYYLGRILLHRHDVQEARKMFQDAQPMLSRLAGLQDPIYLQCRYYLALSLFAMSAFGEARPMLEEILNSKSQHSSVQDIRSILAPFYLGRILVYQHKLRDAGTYFRGSLEASGNRSSCQDLPREHIEIECANCLLEMGKFEEPAQMMRRVVETWRIEIEKSRSYHSHGRWVLSRSLYFLKRYDEAVEQLRLAITAFESDLGREHIETSLARAYLADCLCELGRYQEAEPLVVHAAAQRVEVQAIKQSVIKAIGTYWLGRRALGLKQLQEAENQFQIARSLWGRLRSKAHEPSLFDCRYYLAFIQLERERHADAQSLFAELAKEQYETDYLAEAVDSQYWLGHSLHAQKKWSAAQPPLQRIIDDKIEGKRVKNVFSRTHFLIGQCLYFQQNNEAAKTQFELALQSPNVLPHRPRIFLGCSLFRLGQYKEASQQFQLLVDASTKDAQSSVNHRYWLGKSYYELRNWNEARKHLQLAHKLADKAWPNAADCQYCLARVLFATRNFAAARLHFQLLCNTEGKHQKPVKDYEYYLGCCLVEMERYGRAKNVFAKVLLKLRKQEPKDTVQIRLAMYQEARCLARLGLCQKAEGLLKGMVSFFESNPSRCHAVIPQLHFELGLIADRHGQWARASGLFQMALFRHIMCKDDSNLDRQKCQFHLAGALCDQQKFDEALRLFKQVLDERKGALRTPHQDIIDAQLGVCRSLFQQDKLVEVYPLLFEALEWQIELSGTDHVRCLPIRCLLGETAYRNSDFEQAESLLTNVVSRMQSADDIRITAGEWLVRCYAMLALALSKLGRTDEAKQQVAKALEMDPAKATSIYRTMESFEEVFGELLPEETPPEQGSGTEQTPPCASLQSLALTDKHSCVVEQQPPQLQFKEPLASKQEGACVIDASESINPKDNALEHDKEVHRD